MAKKITHELVAIDQVIQGVGKKFMNRVYTLIGIVDYWGSFLLGQEALGFYWECGSSLGIYQLYTAQSIIV